MKVPLALLHEFGPFFLAVENSQSGRERLTVSFVSLQILTSVRCPTHAPWEHVLTQRVPSHVSSVNPVSESLRMDRSAMVRILAVFVQECATLCLYSWAQVCVCVYSSIEKYQTILSYSAMSQLGGDCASSVEHVSQLVCKQHQVWHLGSKAASSVCKNPKYYF